MQFAGDYQQPARMAAKLKAIPLPADLSGMSVLDVGCDHGFWCELAANRGASYVLGVDRGREVRGRGFVDLAVENGERIFPPQCSFMHMEVGRQWRTLGRFDLVLVLSVYHHVYEQAGGDHHAVWYWLRRQMADDGVLLWEGPTGPEDSVVARNVSAANHAAYNREMILAAARRWFDVEIIGPALHEPTREVWRCKPRPYTSAAMAATMRSGAGGATLAFQYADGRRIDELTAVLGFEPFPGSLNLHTEAPFEWSQGYFRSQILDVVDRKAGLASRWAARWTRFYPVEISGVPAVAFRFEGERYSNHLVELIAGTRLRSSIPGPGVMLTRML